MPKQLRTQKVTNFVKGSIKYPFRKRLSLADKQGRDTPTERIIPIFHPSPFSDGKLNFQPSHLIGFHIKQTTPIHARNHITA